MKILLTNDDGIESKGMNALIDQLKGKHELYVSAPHRQRSAYSHSVTYFMRHRQAWKKEIDGVVSAWAVDATPADCVYYGCFAMMDERPDLIISGINHGENLSTDCIYSGTIGAASEGMIIGIPSMAVSLCSYTSEDFANAAAAAEQLIPYFMADPHRMDYVLNVNVPALDEKMIKGYKITEVEGFRDYEKKVDVVDQADGSMMLACDNVPMRMRNMINTAAGDVTAVKQGYISLTPLDNDMCRHEQLDEMKKYEDIAYQCINALGKEGIL